MDSMKFTHDGIEVTYNGPDDQWEFQLRGKHRTAPTPAKAIEFIDKDPAPKKREKFQTFEAYRADCDNIDVRKVTITSISDNENVWIYDAAKDSAKKPYDWRIPAHRSGRERIQVKYLLQISAENDAILEKIKTAKWSERAQQELQRTLAKELKRIEIPKEFQS